MVKGNSECAKWSPSLTPLSLKRHLPMLQVSLGLLPNCDDLEIQAGSQAALAWTQPVRDSQSSGGDEGLALIYH